jgi:ParB-like chromosome segregation protein Spo0J
MNTTQTLTSPRAGATNELSPHPLSEIFPRMSADEIKTLAKDIKANGLKEPITLYDGKILDGNNRYRACLKIGYRSKDGDTRQFDPKTQGTPLAFVVSANLHRRHLTTSQRAFVAATLVTTKLGYNQYNQTGVTNKQAAELLGVGEATVKMAKAVDDEAAPEIKEKVQKGELALGAAKKVLKFNKDQQVAELAKIKAKADADKKKEEEAKQKKKGGASTSSAANAAMKDVDDFKAKWQAFNDMQRKAFVMSFVEELTGLLEYVREQQAMIGGAKAA